jgi:uncharacterized glyoxalase superfamily protein PhnB
MSKVKIIKTRYVLAVQDLSKSVEYYKTKLNFQTIWEDGVGWHCLGRDGWEMMLGECREDRSAFELENHSYFAYINVEHVDDLHAELTSKGCEISHRLQTKSWGQREFGIRTIDGHRIMFGETVNGKQ